MNDHIGDSAALYALGLLDPGEAQALDAHVQGCERCASALAQAFDDVAAMAAMQPRFDAPAALDTRVGAIWETPKATASRWNLRLAAIAAVLVIALLPTAFLVQREQAMHQAMLADAGLLSRMASSPHRVVAFTGGTDAKVVYGKDGSWYGVIVRGVSTPLRLIWMHDGTSTMLGHMEIRGNVAMLYLPKSHRMDTLALANGNQVVAEAKLAF